MKLENKSIVITGGSSGIGKATALRCAKDGAKVLVAARSEDKLKQTVEEINQTGGKGYYISTDVTDGNQVKDLFKYAVKELGCVDVVFNNAGLGYVKRIFETSDQEIKKMVNVNLLGLCYVAKYASQVMKEQKSGHLINTSSLAGLISVPQWAVYTATKWGVTGLTETIRQELKEYNVIVSSVHPGAVDTNFFSQNKANIDLSQFEQKITPEEVAEEVYKLMLTDQRKVLIPNMAKSYSFLYKFIPGLTEKLISRLGSDVKYEDEPEESEFAYIKPCPKCEE